MEYITGFICLVKWWLFVIQTEIDHCGELKYCDDGKEEELHQWWILRMSTVMAVRDDYTFFSQWIHEWKF